MDGRRSSKLAPKDNPEQIYIGEGETRQAVLDALEYAFKNMHRRQLIVQLRNGEIVSGETGHADDQRVWIKTTPDVEPGAEVRYVEVDDVATPEGPLRNP
jgi:hypothetical protein